MCVLVQLRLTIGLISWHWYMMDICISFTITRNFLLKTYKIYKMPYFVLTMFNLYSSAGITIVSHKQCVSHAYNLLSFTLQLFWKVQVLKKIWPTLRSACTNKWVHQAGIWFSLKICFSFFVVDCLHRWNDVLGMFCPWRFILLCQNCVCM